MSYRRISGFYFGLLDLIFSFVLAPVLWLTRSLPPDASAAVALGPPPRETDSAIAGLAARFKAFIARAACRDNYVNGRFSYGGSPA